MPARRPFRTLARPAALCAFWMAALAAIGAAPHALGLIPTEPPPIVFDDARARVRRVVIMPAAFLREDAARRASRAAFEGACAASAARPAPGRDRPPAAAGACRAED